VIGEVCSGMDVVDKLKKAPPGSAAARSPIPTSHGEGASRIRHQVERGGVASPSSSVVMAAALLFRTVASGGPRQPAQVNTIKDIFAKPG